MRITRETLRRLTPDGLARVGGGGDYAVVGFSGECLVVVDYGEDKWPVDLLPRTNAWTGDLGVC